MSEPFRWTLALTEQGNARFNVTCTARRPDDVILYSSSRTVRQFDLSAMAAFLHDCRKGALENLLGAK